MTDTHPLWRPFEQVSDEELAQARVVPQAPTGVEVVPPDPAWPDDFRRVRATVVEALGDRALSVEHVGSTSVPDLWAKPVIDADLIVADSGDEASYLPDLEAAGFELRIREPEWDEHRCFRGEDPATNLHVWSPTSIEPRRHLVFRDWLREHEDDRTAYAEIKRKLAETGGFTDVMHYNNAKGGLIYDIYERIFAADPEHPHTPRPRSQES